MKITKRQLRRIIKEEMTGLAEQRQVSQNDLNMFVDELVTIAGQDESEEFANPGGIADISFSIIKDSGLEADFPRESQYFLELAFDARTRLIQSSLDRLGYQPQPHSATSAGGKNIRFTAKDVFPE